MKIDQSVMGLYSQRKAVQHNTVKETLKAWVGEDPANAQTITRERQFGEGEAVELNLSRQAAAAFKRRADMLAADHDQRQLRAQSPPAQSHAPIRHKSAAVASVDDQSEEDIAAPELRMLMILFGKMFGISFKLFSLDDAADEPQDSVRPTSAGGAEAAAAPTQNGPAGWGLEYHYEESYFESETTAFSASGLIRTADGQEIQFNLQLEMSRQFMTRTQLDVRLGDAAAPKDPLVINFEGRAAQLTDRKFAFDLDADGQMDQIAFVGPHSGFLAIDRNDDGVVNNGTELFGPQTGQGFTELAALDSDGNSWLDENDADFGRLRVWMKDAQGVDQLHTLAAVGVGAIYLNPVSSEFGLKDQQNTQLGQIRTTSVFLTEQGSAGTVQQVDLVV
jgi:hypothetical protein